MSEERMLRLDAKTFGYIRREFYNSDWREMKLPDDFKDAEPAPPKEWVPDCHDRNANGCAGSIRTIFNAIENGKWAQPESFMGSACKQCPYRKRD